MAAGYSRGRSLFRQDVVWECQYKALSMPLKFDDLAVIGYIKPVLSGVWNHFIINLQRIMRKVIDDPLCIVVNAVFFFQPLCNLCADIDGHMTFSMSWQSAIGAIQTDQIKMTSFQIGPGVIREVSGIMCIEQRFLSVRDAVDVSIL